MAIDFDPNSKPIKQHVWATYIEVRHPQFKTYRTLGHAKQSLYRYHSDMVLYRLNDDGKWQEVIQYSPPEWTAEAPGFSAQTDWEQALRPFRTFCDQLSEIKA